MLLVEELMLGKVKVFFSSKAGPGAANLNSLPHSLVPGSSCLVILSPDSRLSWTNEVGEKLSKLEQLNPPNTFW